MRHQYAGVENARPENSAPGSTGGKCGTGNCRTKMQGWKMQDWKEQETILYGTPHIAYVYSVLHEASIEYPVGLKELECDRYPSVVVPASGARW